MPTTDMEANWDDIHVWLKIGKGITECPPSFNIPYKTVSAELKKFYDQHSGNPNFPAEQYAILLSGVQSHLPNETLKGWAADLVFSCSEEDIFKMLPEMSEEQQAALQAAVTLIEGRIDAADTAAATAAEDEATVRAEVEAAVAAADAAEDEAAVRAEVEAAVAAADAAEDEATVRAEVEAAVTDYDLWIEEVPLQLHRSRFVH